MCVRAATSAVALGLSSCCPRGRGEPASIGDDRWRQLLRKCHTFLASYISTSLRPCAFRARTSEHLRGVKRFDSNASRRTPVATNGNQAKAVRIALVTLLIGIIPRNRLLKLSNIATAGWQCTQAVSADLTICEAANRQLRISCAQETNPMALPQHSSTFVVKGRSAVGQPFQSSSLWCGLLSSGASR